MSVQIARFIMHEEWRPIQRGNLVAVQEESWMKIRVGAKPEIPRAGTRNGALYEWRRVTVNGDELDDKLSEWGQIRDAQVRFSRRPGVPQSNRIPM